MGIFFQMSISVWTEEGVCIVLNATVTADMNCSYSCGSDCWRLSKYPCLQVFVSVNNTGRVNRLSHNEETHDSSSEVSTDYKAGGGGVGVGGGAYRITEPAQMLTVDVDQLRSTLADCGTAVFAFPSCQK